MPWPKPGKHPSFLALYSLIFMCVAVYGTYLPVYLAQAGYRQAEIGLLFAVSTLITIVAQPVWGIAGDRAKSKNSVLLVMLLGSAAAISVYQFSTAFAFLIAIAALFTFFQSSIIPLSDAITLEYAAEAGWKFGPIRLAGTLGYAVMAVLAGFIARRRVENIFGLYLILAVLAILTVPLLPKVRGHQAAGRKMPMRALFRHMQLVILMFFTMAVHITLGFYYTFFPIYYRGMGADNVLLGWSTFIMAVSEVPFLLLADKILAKIGVRGALMISAAVTGLRWLLFYRITDPYLLLPLQILHGAAFIVLTYCMATYINAEVPKELRASGQTLHWLLSLGVARVIGSYGGGLIADAVGIRTGFLYNGCFVLAALIVFAILFRRADRINQRELSPSP